MIMSTHAEKEFDKIEHPFMIEMLSKVRIEATYINRIRAIYDKIITNIIFNGQT